MKKTIGPVESEKFKLFLSDDHPKVCKRNQIRSLMAAGQL